MSSFHVTKVLSEYPELRDILTTQVIHNLTHAKVERVGAATLNSYAGGGHCFYIISNTKTLLRKLNPGSFRIAFLKAQSLREAVIEVGVENVGYIAYTNTGQYDGTPYSELYVLKLPNEGLRHMMQNWNIL